MSLSPILQCQPRPNEVVVLQSSTGQTILPILQLILKNASKTPSKRLVLVCLLHIPRTLSSDTTAFELVDLSSNISEYCNTWIDPCQAILSAVNNVPSNEQITVVVDSIETLCSEIGSVSGTYKFLKELNTLVQARTVPSQLILHTLSPSKITHILVQPSFSPSLTYLIAHPVVLLTHLATSYFTPPPPASPEAKFWGVFLPISERGYETDQLVFGPAGQGSGNRDEFVVEVLIRGSGKGSQRKSLERTLEGWSSIRGGNCLLTELSELKSVWTRKTLPEAAPDPTQNLSFNLNLTASQQESRAQVPLPYAHEGQPPAIQTATSSVIFYDPDSADDIDDDDPDEDLDI